MKGKTGNLAYFFLILGFTLLLEQRCLAGLPLTDARPDHLLADARLLGSKDILADFANGAEVSKVIVTLHPTEEAALATTSAGSSKSSIDNTAGPSGTETISLRNNSAKIQMRHNVATTITNALMQFNKSDIRVTRRFSYLAGFAAEVTPTGLVTLLASPRVLTVEKNQNHAPYLAQGIGLINASTVRSSYTGTGISIALCDTGIDTSHPKLGGDSSAIFNSKVIGGYDFADNDGDATPGIAGSSHGTACAGIAAGLRRVTRARPATISAAWPPGPSSIRSR